MYSMLCVFNVESLWPMQIEHKDAMSWLNHWGTDEKVTLQNNNNIKNIVASKFKEKFWCDNDLKLKEN